MSTTIALLSDAVINQIAAGEVIENPASIVKELIDNAIDAGATSIAVEIQAGGQQGIKVEDNGCGMSRADVELCLLRHATSKIRCVEDLDSLQTMGFRGEALAAIGSVTKLQIRTSMGQEATRLYAEGGQIRTIEPVARNSGTTIEANQLFFNAPARRKFQKSVQANRAQVVRVVQSLSLAHPEIAFSLESQGERLLQVSISGWKERIEEICSLEFCKEGIWIEESALRGFLGCPSAVKTTRLGQYLFLNRRPIVSLALSKAVREGYGTRIAEQAYPSFVLFLERSSDEFDVNVHPQKREVRFRDEGKIFTQVRKIVQRSFLPMQEPWSDAEIVFSPPSPALCAMREDPPLIPLSQQQFISEGQPLAVVGFFLLAQRREELLLIDLSEAVKASVLQAKGRQSLIWPLEIPITQEEAERAEEMIDRCAHIGIEARRIGPRQLCFDAIPEWIDAVDVPQLFAALKEDLWQGLPASETLARFCLNPKAKRITLAEAALLWKQGSCKEVKIEKGDLEGLFGRKK